MDPITLIVTAVALGAALGLKDTTAQAVRDAYAGLKALIRRKYEEIDLSSIEKKPDSKDRQGVLQEDLEAAGAGADQELLAEAAALVEAVKSSGLAAPPSLQLNLDDLQAEFVELRRLRAAGDVKVTLERGEISGGVTFEDIEAGTGASRPN